MTKIRRSAPFEIRQMIRKQWGEYIHNAWIHPNSHLHVEPKGSKIIIKIRIDASNI